MASIALRATISESLPARVIVTSKCKHTPCPKPVGVVWQVLLLERRRERAASEAAALESSAVEAERGRVLAYLADELSQLQDEVEHADGLASAEAEERRELLAVAPPMLLHAPLEG